MEDMAKDKVSNHRNVASIAIFIYSNNVFRFCLPISQNVSQYRIVAIFIFVLHIIDISATGIKNVKRNAINCCQK